MRLIEDPVALRFHLHGAHDLSISHIANTTDDDLDSLHKRATVRDIKAGVLNHDHDAA
jgi:hypothetical protein